MDMSQEIYLFISPHLDDVALSCGGYARRLTSAGERVIVATVMTADPPASEPLSWLARRNHASWRLGDAPFGERCREDLAAIASLGAEAVQLGLLDAIYRRDAPGQPLYTQRSVAVPVHPYDWQFQLKAVEQRLRALLETHVGQALQVFCPLTAGGHVDHVIVRRAVENVCPTDIITYYEDYPYAHQRNAVQALFTARGGFVQPARGGFVIRRPQWQATLITLTAVEVDARIAAVACYESQIAGLFPSNIERLQEILQARLPMIARYVPKSPQLTDSYRRMSVALRAYIARVGGERYWRNSNILHDSSR